MADKLTDNDIKKALECCASSTGAEACKGCPFNEKDICDTEDDAPQKYALDLINRLESDKVGLINGQETLQNYIKEQQAEIDELKKRIVFWRKDLNYQPEKERAEAIKEFATRLKAVSHPYADTQMVFEVQIDNLVKEMTEVSENE